MCGICTINENLEPYISQNEGTKFFRIKSRANAQTFRTALRAAIAGSGEEKIQNAHFQPVFANPTPLSVRPIRIWALPIRLWALPARI